MENVVDEFRKMKTMDEVIDFLRSPQECTKNCLCTCPELPYCYGEVDPRDWWVECDTCQSMRYIDKNMDDDIREYLLDCEYCAYMDDEDFISQVANFFPKVKEILEFGLSRGRDGRYQSA